MIPEDETSKVFFQKMCLDKELTLHDCLCTRANSSLILGVVSSDPFCNNYKKISFISKSGNRTLVMVLFVPLFDVMTLLCYDETNMTKIGS